MRAVDAVVWPQEIKRAGAQRIAGIAAGDEGGPLRIALAHRRCRGPAWVDPFFHDFGIATTRQIIGQGHRGREKSHFAIAGPELERPDSGVGDNDPAPERVEMVLPFVHPKR